MITAQGFVELFGKDKKEKLVKFAKVASGYSSGRPRLIFDGELVASSKRYPYLASYAPKSGDRVMVVHGVIIGKII